MTEPLAPGATLGVFGGGQLGRMFGIAARRMGYRFAVYCPDANGPASAVADFEVCAAYDDVEAVERFARQVDAVTFEFENVSVVTAEAAGRHVPVRPAGTLLETTQDRLREKRALQRLGLPVAPFAAVETTADLEAAAAAVPGPGVLKTASWGYDGKGQRRVASADELPAVWAELGSPRAVLEGWIGFEREISIVGARGVDGSISLYDPSENAHENHILDVSSFPAPVGDATLRAAREIATIVLQGLEVVGVVCVELFCLPSGELIVNELAPRPHNSGHATIDGHATCQFEQQVRTLCGLPLGSTELEAEAVAMANLLGDLWDAAPDGEPRWSAALSEPGIRLHLYGKAEPRPGRKMGHLVARGASREDAIERAKRARAALVGL